jgi:hypothetical protein
MHLYKFRLGGRDVFSYIVSSDRKFPVAAVNQHRKLNGRCTSIGGNCIQCSADSTACGKYVIHKDYVTSIDIEWNAAGVCWIFFSAVIAVAGNIKFANRDSNSFDGHNVGGKNFSQRESAAFNSKKYNLSLYINIPLES